MGQKAEKKNIKNCDTRQTRAKRTSATPRHQAWIPRRRTAPFRPSKGSTCFDLSSTLGRAGRVNQPTPEISTGHVASDPRVNRSPPTIGSVLHRTSGWKPTKPRIHSKSPTAHIASSSRESRRGRKRNCRVTWGLVTMPETAS